MARRTERLTDVAIRRKTAAGVHPDGRGLYLQVSKAGSKSWLFRFARHGRERWMGLGSYPDTSLADARSKALECRRLLKDGMDPIDHRRARDAAARLEAANAVTFRDCARAYIEAHRPGWKNAKHAGQWASTLETYAYPVFGDLPVAAIDTALVLKALEPLWRTKTETGTRLRQRIEAILDWATVRGYRTGDNPARWRGHLNKLLPQRSKVQRIRHHTAMPYKELPGFFAALRVRRSWSARALTFTILTAARTGEVRGARWTEIDLEGRLWTIPAERTKAYAFREE